MEPGKTPGNIAFTPICNTEQQESQDEEMLNFGESQEYEVELAFSEDATSGIQDPAPIAHLRAPKRKRGKLTLSYQEEMKSSESGKLE
jgi:hypothetical protein